VRLTGYAPRATTPVAPARPNARALPGGKAPPSALRRWSKRVVIITTLVAVGLPAMVLMGRSMLAQNELAEQSGSKAAMVCVAGQGRPLDDSTVWGWLFGGSYFQCGDWQTREARERRAREQAEAANEAREKARREGVPPP
jgi:hypothetical protein